MQDTLNNITKFDRFLPLNMIATVPDNLASMSHGLNKLLVGQSSDNDWSSSYPAVRKRYPR